ETLSTKTKTDTRTDNPSATSFLILLFSALLITEIVPVGLLPWTCGILDWFSSQPWPSVTCEQYIMSSAITAGEAKTVFFCFFFFMKP
uniref:Uncharacterized protein n=1 Tax=Mus spicilegus TaxID=10103 RepID=A0A8C6N2D7_MUSSI